MSGPATETKEGLGGDYKAISLSFNIVIIINIIINLMIIIINIILMSIIINIIIILLLIIIILISQMKEYFGYSLYSFYDMEKDLVDSKVMIMIAFYDCFDYGDDDDENGLNDHEDYDGLNLPP